MCTQLFSLSLRSKSTKRDTNYVKWQPGTSDDEKISKHPMSAYWTSEIAVQNLKLTKLTEITSLWIKQITIQEQPNLLNLTSFWYRFCFNLLCLFMTTITQMRKTKNIADVGHQRFTKSVFNTPPLTAKSSDNFHCQLFWCWLVLINVEMLVVTRKKRKFVHQIWLSKCWTKNEFSECFHARSLSMFCDVRVCYRWMAVVVKAMHTTSTHSILLESLLSDV